MKNAAALAFVAALTAGCRSAENKAQDHLQRGKALLEKKDYQSAQLELKTAVSLDARLSDGYYQLAQVQLALQDWVGAAGSLDRAVRLDPENVNLRLLRGQFFLSAREYRKAEEDARFLVEKDKSSVAAHQLLGGSLAGQQQNDEAAEEFAKVTDLSPSDPSAFINLGVAEVSLKRFEEAGRHFEKAIELDPTSITAYLNLAAMHRMQGAPARAIEIIRQSIKANPQAIDLYITLAELLEGQPGGESEATLNRLRAEVPHSRDAALALGNYFSRRERQAEAIVEYSRGLQAAPQDLELRKRLLDGYLAVGDLGKAAPLDEALFKEAPSDSAVRIHHARMLSATSRLPEAIETLEKVIREAPRSPQAHYFLAMAYWKRGDSTNLTLARRELNAALEIAPDYRAAARSSIALYAATGDLAEAERQGRKHVEQYPTDAAVHVTLGQVYLARKRVTDARKAFQAALKLTPADPGAAGGLAQTYEAEKNWAAAEKQLESAMALDPGNVRTLGLLADFFAARNQPQKAVDRIRQFVKVHPEIAEAHLFLGAAEMATNDLPSAQAALERAIQLDPGLMAAYVRLGQIYQQQGKTREAILRYEKALAVQPNQVQLCTLIGNLYLNEGNLEAARKYYERALTIDRDFGVAAGNLAWVQLQLGGNLDAALGMARDAVARYPAVVPVRDTLGWILYKKGLYSEALTHLKECVRLAPDTAAYHYHLGKTRLALADFPEAKASLTEALRLNLTGPDADDARRELAKMK